MTKSQGHCAPHYAPIRVEFDRHLASGEESGGSICIIEQGETGVDLWGGSAGPRPDTGWGEDTVSMSGRSPRR